MSVEGYTSPPVHLVIGSFVGKQFVAESAFACGVQRTAGSFGSRSLSYVTCRDCLRHRIEPVAKVAAA